MNDNCDQIDLLFKFKQCQEINHNLHTVYFNNIVLDQLKNRQTLLAGNALLNINKVNAAKAFIFFNYILLNCYHLDVYGYCAFDHC